MIINLNQGVKIIFRLNHATLMGINPHAHWAMYELDFNYRL